MEVENGRVVTCLDLRMSLRYVKLSLRPIGTSVVRSIFFFVIISDLH